MRGGKNILCQHHRSPEMGVSLRLSGFNYVTEAAKLTREFDETLGALCFAFHAANVGETLGGRLKYFLFSSQFQENLIQFDEHIFQMSGKKPPTR